MSASTSRRPDTHEMVVVHRVFRREYRLLPRMVEAVAVGDVARASVVAAHAREIGEVLHHHHTGEDEVIWPLLRERATVESGVVDRMASQHERVAGLLARVDELLPVWVRSAAATPRDELVALLDQASRTLEEHLADEEEHILPLCAEHLSVEEWSQLGGRGMPSMPMSRALVLLGHVLEEADAQERKALLAHLPLPGRVLFSLVGRRQYAREVATLRAGLTVPGPRQG